MTATLTDAQAAQVREAAQKATPGPWKAVSAPRFDSGLVYTSVQPVAVDEDAMKPMAMMNGEFHVCRMSHTAAPWRFEYHRANAAYIALANPATILALLDEREGLAEQLRTANEAWHIEQRACDNHMERAEAAEADAARLRIALEPFAAVAEYDIGEDETDNDVFRPMTWVHARARVLTVGDFRAARAALTTKGTAE